MFHIVYVVPANDTSPYPSVPASPCVVSWPLSRSTFCILRPPRMIASALRAFDAGRFVASNVTVCSSPSIEKVRFHAEPPRMSVAR